MQDNITRDIVVKAGKEKVYAAITDPAQITEWFPSSVEEGSLEMGQSPVFVFKQYDHRTRIHVEAAKPFDYFAYRWVPGAKSMLEDVRTVPNTLVEFFIEETAGGTKVTVKESGFTALPPEVAEESFNQNSGGWKMMMERLEKYTNQ